ncbi:uncharacterized protein TM35_000102020 [Trypanosoma theileri]|uniref:Spermidine synthase n=1 Tax=Trypanosoma theileri TaxID=67003 RepID=A0A1X0NZ16_9TRYP|nr:uncharacterized protein TM35_000102020 [Trypanosoma theileri]ORC89934.1 hypothetical protein TM35_000102020 [Trypanosoma theileri]
MANRLSSSLTPGQRPRRQYLNKATEFFFRELDKGFSSIYVVLSTGALLSVAGWKLMVYYIEPRRATQFAEWRRPYSRVPLSDAHNFFWGFAAAEPHPNHIAAGLTADVEEALRRPTLVYSAASEVGGSVMCMQLPEYDAQRGDDVVYRSLHYVENSPSILSSSSSSLVEVVGGEEEGRGGNTMKEKKSQQQQQQQQQQKKEEKEEEEETSLYLSRMPGGGASVIHGMVKCKAITSQNNCVPYAGHLESEYARKMMLALGPVHILRDIAKTTFPFRFTTVKETPISALVCGLHSGEIPRWLSNTFPNFHVDVVERDGTLARICRRFMGFQESSNLRLFIADPIEFLRHSAIVNTNSVNSRGSAGQRYDLIMLDTVDGMGKLSTQYGRLEFINNVRNSLTSAGCVIASIPNRDGAFLYNMVQNWRVAFTGRTVILVHCVTSPHTMLMTFQDDADRGKANFGAVADAEEFRDLLRTKLSHYGPQRVTFDLTREVSDESFRILLPGRTYPLTAYLPAGHPELKDVSTMRSEGGRKWGDWLRHWSSTWLTPTQRADLQNMGR